MQWVQNVIPSQWDKVFNYPVCFSLATAAVARMGRAAVDTGVHSVCTMCCCWDRPAAGEHWHSASCVAAVSLWVTTVGNRYLAWRERTFMNKRPEQTLNLHSVLPFHTCRQQILDCVQFQFEGPIKIYFFFQKATDIWVTASITWITLKHTKCLVVIWLLPGRGNNPEPKQQM